MDHQGARTSSSHDLMVSLAALRLPPLETMKVRHHYIVFNRKGTHYQQQTTVTDIVELCLENTAPDAVVLELCTLLLDTMDNKSNLFYQVVNNHDNPGTRSITIVSTTDAEAELVVQQRQRTLTTVQNTPDAWQKLYTCILGITGTLAEESEDYEADKHVASALQEMQSCSSPTSPTIFTSLRNIGSPLTPLGDLETSQMEKQLNFF